MTDPAPEIQNGLQSGMRVVIEFGSREPAWTFYNSPEYTPAHSIREQSAETDLLLAKGI